MSININAHGTSTPLNDYMKLRPSNLCLGNTLRIMVSSTKSMTGHMLGGTGGVEAIFGLRPFRKESFRLQLIWIIPERDAISTMCLKSPGI